MFLGVNWLVRAKLTRELAKRCPMRKGIAKRRIRMSASSWEAVQSEFNSSKAREASIFNSARTLPKASMTWQASSNNSPVMAKSLPSYMPGIRLCRRQTSLCVSESTWLASRRMSINDPGLRFCGMALEAYVLDTKIHGRDWAYCVMMSCRK